MFMQVQPLTPVGIMPASLEPQQRLLGTAPVLEHAARSGAQGRCGSQPESRLAHRRWREKSIV